MFSIVNRDVLDEVDAIKVGHPVRIVGLVGLSETSSAVVLAVNGNLSAVYASISGGLMCLDCWDPFVGALVQLGVSFDLAKVQSYVALLKHDTDVATSQVAGHILLACVGTWASGIVLGV